MISSLLLVAAAASGCASSRPPAERAPDLRRRQTEKEARHPIVAVRKIVFETGETLGYLKVNEDASEKPGRKPVRVYWVHDPYFKVLGFYTETGETFRVNRDGGLDDLGIQDVDDAKRVLLHVPSDVKIELRAMDAPRTLESDAEKAAAAAAPASTPEEAAPPPANQ